MYICPAVNFLYSWLCRNDDSPSEPIIRKWNNKYICEILVTSKWKISYINTFMFSHKQWILWENLWMCVSGCCTYACICICVNMCVKVCVLMCVSLRLLVCLFVRVLCGFMCVRECVCTCVRVCARACVCVLCVENERMWFYDKSATM